MRMTSFTAIPSLLLYAALNQDGGSTIEKRGVDQEQKLFAEVLEIVW